MNKRRNWLAGLIMLVLTCTASLVSAETDQAPRYKPSSRSPQAQDIRSNAYGASRSAPDALEIGDQVTDFSAAMPGGGLVSLRAARRQGPVAIVFYRGHW
jgi:hypothetical protein